MYSITLNWTIYKVCVLMLELMAMMQDLLEDPVHQIRRLVIRTRMHRRSLIISILTAHRWLVK